MEPGGFIYARGRAGQRKKYSRTGNQLSNPENMPETSEKPETGTSEETSQQQETASEKPAETSSEFHIDASRLNQRLVERVKPDTAIDQPAFNINVRQKQEKAP